MSRTWKSGGIYKVGSEYERSYFYSYCYYQGKNSNMVQRPELAYTCQVKATEAKSGYIHQTAEGIYWLT